MATRLLPTQKALTEGAVVAATAFGASFVVNRMGSQLAGIPGFKFISEIEKNGFMESSIGLIILVLLSMAVGRMVGVSV